MGAGYAEWCSVSGSGVLCEYDFSFYDGVEFDVFWWLVVCEESEVAECGSVRRGVSVDVWWGLVSRLVCLRLYPFFTRTISVLFFHTKLSFGILHTCFPLLLNLECQVSI